MFTDTVTDRDAVSSLYENTDHGEPFLAHMIEGKGDVTAAYVNGTPVVALCGHVFVPTRNPDNYPLCQRCWEVFQNMAKDGKFNA